MSDFKARTKLTPERAHKMLQKEDMEITLEEAEKILEFLRKLANIAVSNYLKNKGKDL
ncbi:MAG TPA: hypothetical protein VL022_00540 [Moheibacter sp.]|nr:hypothetical protein [Moheibacter sp.]